MSNKEPEKDPQHEPDDIMDDIDRFLSENAEDFIKSYVQKGGQGSSSLLDPQFFVGAATASLVAGVGWDAFKTVTARVIHALRHVPGVGLGTVVDPDDGSLDRWFEVQLREEWEVAEQLLGGAEPDHSIEEATALHWALFFMELQRTQGFVRLRPEHYERISRAADATPEGLEPSQLVARIIDRWLKENPMAEKGITS